MRFVRFAYTPQDRFLFRNYEAIGYIESAFAEGCGVLCFIMLKRLFNVFGYQS
jgi:hypothetical protein